MTTDLELEPSHQRRIPRRSILAVGFPFVFGVVALLVALWALLRGPEQLPRIYEAASPVLVADRDTPTGSLVSPILDGLPVVDPAGEQVPIALAACSEVDEPIVSFERTWEATDLSDDTRVRVADQVVTFPARFLADECRTLASSIFIPARVLDLARAEPDLVWRIVWATTPLDPRGLQTSAESEPFLLTDERPTSIIVRDEELEAELLGLA